jgi:methionyl-tRNA formyltransferase
MSPSTIIFCGTPEFACPSLQALHEDPAFDVVQVITQPDKPVGRKRVVTAPAVKVLAKKLGLPVEQPNDINSTHYSLLTTDYLVVVAYGQILKERILKMPKIAAVNLHPSLLPIWRGPSPIQNSLLAGDKETGVTIQHMVEEVDAGAILSQEKITIDPRETKTALTERLAKEGAELLTKTLKAPLTETHQDDSKATFCKKLTRSVGQVDPHLMTAEEIDRYVRALVPWPGVSIHCGTGILPVRSGGRPARDESVKLIETLLTPHADSFELPCAKGSILYVTKIQSPGKNVMTGEEWGKGKIT